MQNVWLPELVRAILPLPHGAVGTQHMADVDYRLTPVGADLVIRYDEADEGRRQVYPPAKPPQRLVTIDAEPTSEMVEAGELYVLRSRDPSHWSVDQGEYVRGLFAAMLAKAPANRQEA